MKLQEKRDKKKTMNMIIMKQTTKIRRVNSRRSRRDATKRQTEKRI